MCNKLYMCVLTSNYCTKQRDYLSMIKHSNSIYKLSQYCYSKPATTKEMQNKKTEQKHSLNCRNLGSFKLQKSGHWQFKTAEFWAV